MLHACLTEIQKSVILFDSEKTSNGEKMSGFFEEYKSLDNLCKDILESEKGVSEYIERMEKEERGRMIVADWDRDYKRLKSMRYIRNRLAHDDGAYENDLCTDKDIAWVSDFQARIMNEEDPLTVLYNYDLEQGGNSSSDAYIQEKDHDNAPSVNSQKKPVKRSSQSKKKAAAKEPVTPQAAKSFKPSFDLISALAAILLAVGIITALLVSCL